MTTYLSVLDYEYANSKMLWVMLVLPVLIFLYYQYFRKNKNAVRMTILSAESKRNSNFQFLKDLFFMLQIAGLAFLIVALAQPRDPKLKKVFQQEQNKGIDIMITMDLSASMLAEDFEPNRLSASIEMAKEFIDNRPNDRIGLTVYGGEALLVSPVTTDHLTLKEKLDELSTDMVHPSTAIGDGLDMAGAGLFRNETKSKVVILLTDGVNNAGNVNPLDAAMDAKAYDIKVYTIGIGKPGTLAPMPVDYGGMVITQNVPVEIDEDLMKDISKTTDGKYFLAENKSKLREVYKEIDRLEKSPFDSTKITVDPPEEFRKFAIPGMLLILIPLLLNRTILRQIP